MLTNMSEKAVVKIRGNNLFSSMNIARIALGIAVCIALLVYVRLEVGYESRDMKDARIYRLDVEGNLNGRLAETSLSPAPLGQFLENRLPQVESVTRLYAPSALTAMGSPVLKYGNTDLKVRHFLFVDPTFTGMFSFKMIRGDPRTALAAPFSVVLTDSEAVRLFGREDPMGKTIVYDGTFRFKVTGVVKNIPLNSVIEFDCLGSMRSLPEVTGESDVMTNSHRFSFYTYLLFRKGANPSAVEKRMQQEASGFWDPVVREMAGNPRVVLRPLRAPY